MKKFRVMLEGGNVALVSRRWFRRHQENYGFYTTRYVVGEDEADAEAQAIALVRAELAETNISAFNGLTILVRRAEIEELSSFEDALVPGGGFAFFPEGS